MTSEAYPLLGSVAVEEGILTQAELEDVLRKAAERGVPLGEMLFKLGYVSRDRLLELIAQQYDTSVYNIQEWRADPELLSILPVEFVREYELLPVSLHNGRLVLAAAGPFRVPLADLLTRVSELTGCRADVVICDEVGLRRYITEFFSGVDALSTRSAPAEAVPPRPSDAPATAGAPPDEFSSMLSEIRAEADGGDLPDTGTRVQLDETLDRVFAQLLEVRGHPFSNAVTTNANSGSELLDKAKQYEHMGLYNEALALLGRAEKQLTVALRKATELQEAWGPLLQHVELLRTRISQLESEGAADFAPQEMGRLRDVRDSMHDCVDAKLVDRLRAVVDEGQLLVERVAALSPRHNRRERVIESLARVREVLSRARRLGAQTVAPAAVQAAYRLLEEADGQAREGAWEQVEDWLTQALAHAEAAESQALEYAERRKEEQEELATLCTSVEAVLGELYSHPGVAAITADLAIVQRTVTGARLALEGPGELASHVAALKELKGPGLLALRAQADLQTAEWGSLGRDLEQIAATVREGTAVGFSADAVEAANRTAGDALALFRALGERNLSVAHTVLQSAERRLRDYWDVVGRAQEERQQAYARLAAAAARVGEAGARADDPSQKQMVHALEADLERAMAEVHRGNLGDAAGMLDSVERGLVERVLPALEQWEARRCDATGRAHSLSGVLWELAAEEAANLAPDAYGALAALVAQATEAAAAGDPDATSAAVLEAGEQVDAVRAAIQEARAARTQALEQRVSEVERQLRAAVEGFAGHGAPETLEAAATELQAARRLLDDRSTALFTEAAAQVECHTRAAEVIVEQAITAGATGGVGADSLRDMFQDQVLSLQAAVRQLRDEPDYGVGMDALARATQSVTAIMSALEQQDVEKGFELARDIERTLQQVRSDRQRIQQRRDELREFFDTTLPAHLGAMDGAALSESVPEVWEQLCAVPVAAAAAQETEDIRTLSDLHDRAVELITECTEQDRTVRSRRLVELHEVRAMAHGAVRLATLVGAPTHSPDLSAAAVQLLTAGDAAAEARHWDEAREHFLAATDRAAQAQEAALQISRNAFQAQTDLLRAAATHLGENDITSARAALDAATAAGRRAAPPPVDRPIPAAMDAAVRDMPEL